MRRVALQVLKLISEKPARTSELAEKLGKSQSWISTVVTELEEQNLIEKNRKIELADTYEAALIGELLDSYDLESILAGKREDILQALTEGKKTSGDLESEGLAKSTVYDALKDLKSAGVVAETREGYRIADETLEEFLEARGRSGDKSSYETEDEKIHITENAFSERGKPTAFSAFTRYGIGYYPNMRYLYEGEDDLRKEDVLIHAVLCAENKKQMAICGVFYLKHRSSLDIRELWRLSKRWDCEGKLGDLLAFMDQREVSRDELFLPRGEFNSLAADYGVELIKKYSKRRLLTGLERVGDNLENEVDAYLLGGVNLILKGLKDSTKDIDVALKSRENFQDFVRALKEDNYEERYEIGRTYERLEPGAILEKRGYPRWDIFVEIVANCLHLTEKMKSRSEKYMKRGNLSLYLLSSTDVFLFKSVTGREGDLEDAALIARKERMDWESLFEEIKKQDELTGRYPSFASLDTLDVLKERHDIDPPIRDRLVSYCLENALILMLEEPKTIKDLREGLDFPEHQIYNKLRKLEEENRIEVDREGKLNRYQAKRHEATEDRKRE